MSAFVGGEEQVRGTWWIWQNHANKHALTKHTAIALDLLNVFSIIWIIFAIVTKLFWAQIYCSTATATNLFMFLVISDKLASYYHLYSQETPRNLAVYQGKKTEETDYGFKWKEQKSHVFREKETNAWRNEEGGGDSWNKKNAWPRPHLLLRCFCGRWWPVISVLSVKGQKTSEQCLAGQVQKCSEPPAPPLHHLLRSVHVHDEENVTWGGLKKKGGRYSLGV